MKSTPKSCSCQSCRRGKHGGAKFMVRYDERRFRHAQKIALLKGIEEIQIAPKGNYYD